MAMRYPQQQYGIYGNSLWTTDNKQEYVEVEDDGDSMVPSNSATMNTNQIMGRNSAIKVEEDIGTMQTWHNRPHLQMSQMRHYSQPNMPILSPSDQHINRMVDHNFGPNFGQSSPWPLSAHSESTTPTPSYPIVTNGLPNGYHQSLHYSNTPFNFAHGQTKDPISAISMSPQSSQGGWGSGTSSDNTDPRSTDPQSPHFRPMSPMTVLRSDGIRKKNARFEIPRDRNLANIDALIMQSTDDAEKKELKQQKRLLRNRQAALDSRQRKKTHTEKLEQEKKAFTSQKVELEEALGQLEERFNQEREQWNEQRQQYLAYIKNLEFEREEAIRTKTLETGELRRMNNVLKDCVRDLERQQTDRGYTVDTHDGFTGDYGNFDNLGLEDTWDDHFGLMNNGDMKMGGESPRQDLTPRPPTEQSKTADAVKQDTGFNSNILWMYILLGAQWASNTNSKLSNATTANSVNMPALPEEYRADAGGILKLAFRSRSESQYDMMSMPSFYQTTNPNVQEVVSDSDYRPSNRQPTSSLDVLHTSLATPSHRQQIASVFSLSASSYNHVTNPEGLLDDDDDHDDTTTPAKPTPIEQAFAAVRTSRDDIDKLSGMSGKIHEKSIMLDRVPEKALRDFKKLLAMNDLQEQQQLIDSGQ